MLLAFVNATVLFSPIAIRPVTSTDEGAWGDGGIKKSAVLVAVPATVATDMRPEPVACGTLVCKAVEVLDVSEASVALSFTRLLLLIGSKLVPVIVTAVPAVPIAGVKLVIVGAVESATTKLVELTADPLGLVTEIGPVVAPLGTVVTI